MTVPSDVRRLLSGWPEPGKREQAFPFLTVDIAGFPHVCLLSRAELAVSRAEVLAVLSSPRTTENLRRSGKACLVAVHADTAHYCKLRVRRSIIDQDVLAVALDVTEHKADSAGMPLSPLSYVVPVDLPAEEAWPKSRRLLDLLRS